MTRDWKNRISKSGWEVLIPDSDLHRHVYLNTDCLVKLRFLKVGSEVDPKMGVSKLNKTRGSKNEGQLYLQTPTTRRLDVTPSHMTQTYGGSILSFSGPNPTCRYRTQYGELLYTASQQGLSSMPFSGTSLLFHSCGVQGYIPFHHNK